jgi:hypothetical protein
MLADSFLFHKHPERVQEFALSFGRALVFYPRYDANVCEIALVLDPDPLRLVGRGSAPACRSTPTSMTAHTWRHRSSAWRWRRCSNRP